ncbi:hypothetical protein KZ483_19220 [Paenibacillus sp. sptzw28]|uniref:DUF6884 domain-containing protein n=1 Tax=Paenibacillus sp. sptzw28 TaxID=715179 RepID=UPI001C6F44B9|nr:DUF6884 domain-containing protein [Paenibacillus sp. sptzw28]QYR19988.1 hypothetical protein KZ483_19220 [Paenibacillus sp. sptzw28]
MNRLCIIPCGVKKIWDSNPEASGPYEAQIVYTGTLHKKCQYYANMFFEKWVILSAKYGFLLPGDTVPDNYNAAFGSNSSQIIPLAELRLQAEDKQLTDIQEIVVLGGKKFTSIIPQIFVSPDIKIEYPLIGCRGIGYMLQKLDQSVSSGIELKNITTD